MPLLPLPPLTGGVPIDTGPLPVSDLADVQAAYSSDDIAGPVRTAVQSGQLAQQLAYQKATRYAAAASDPLRATDEYLDEIGSYERGVNRAAGESDTSYRSRVNAAPNLVDPNDIVASANAILAPYTSISCRYYEMSDAVFASEPSIPNAWSNNAFQYTDGGAGATSNYPDRAYDAIANRRPSGHVAFTSSVGRMFVIRAPDISSIDTTVSAAYQLGNPQPPETPAGGGGNFAGEPSDGVAAQNVTFAWSYTATSLSIYQQIADMVESLRGHSIRWVLLSDPYLTA